MAAADFDAPALPFGVPESFLDLFLRMRGEPSEPPVSGCQVATSRQYIARSGSSFQVFDHSVIVFSTT
jgi:hypothetical protein